MALTLLTICFVNLVAADAAVVTKDCQAVFVGKPRATLAQDAAYDGGFNIIAAIERTQPGDGRYNRIRIGAPVPADTLQPRTQAQLAPPIDERLAMEPTLVKPSSWQAAFRRYVNPVSLDRIKVSDSDLYFVPNALTIASTLRSHRSGVFMVGLSTGEIKLIGRGAGTVYFHLSQAPARVETTTSTIVTPEEYLQPQAIVGLELLNSVQPAGRGPVRPTLAVTRAKGTVEHYVLTVEQWSYFDDFQSYVANLRR